MGSHCDVALQDACTRPTYGMSLLLPSLAPTLTCMLSFCSWSGEGHTGISRMAPQLAAYLDIRCAIWLQVWGGGCAAACLSFHPPRCKVLEGPLHGGHG